MFPSIGNHVVSVSGFVVKLYITPIKRTCSPCTLCALDAAVFQRMECKPWQKPSARRVRRSNQPHQTAMVFLSIGFSLALSRNHNNKPTQSTIHYIDHLQNKVTTSKTTGGWYTNKPNKAFGINSQPLPGITRPKPTSSKGSAVQRIQQLSNCRVHIERTSKEVTESVGRWNVSWDECGDEWGDERGEAKWVFGWGFLWDLLVKAWKKCFLKDDTSQGLCDTFILLRYFRSRYMNKHENTFKIF